MAALSLIHLATEAEYKQLFVDTYCTSGPIYTWDNLPVVFYPDMFEHAFYKRATKNWKAPKSSIDLSRCERILWIKEVLLDSSIIPRQGYDKAKNTHDSTRRVALLTPEDYVVVLRNDGNKWRFVTAYLIDNAVTKSKILSAPIWQK